MVQQPLTWSSGSAGPLCLRWTPTLHEAGTDARARALSSDLQNQSISSSSSRAFELNFFRSERGTWRLMDEPRSATQHMHSEAHFTRLLCASEAFYETTHQQRNKWNTGRVNQTARNAKKNKKTTYVYWQNPFYTTLWCILNQNAFVLNTDW